MGEIVIDFNGQCHEVIGIDGYEPIESRLKAFIHFRPLVFRAALRFERRPDKPFDEVKKLVGRIFRESTTLDSMPCYDEVRIGVKGSKKFSELRDALGPLFEGALSDLQRLRDATDKESRQ